MSNLPRPSLQMLAAAVLVGMACNLPAAAQMAPAASPPEAAQVAPAASPPPAQAAPAAPAQAAPAAQAPMQLVPTLVGPTPTVQILPATPPPPMTPEALAIKKVLEEKFPNADVKNVTKSGYFGLYEAQFEGQMVYTDPKVTYLLVGSVFDVNTKQNLTEERLRKLNRIAWDSLPLDLAFKRVKGNGSRKLVIFSDADCPFCARLENELKTVNDVTIYTFLYPIDTLHPDSARKSKMIWCSPDRVKAWDDFFNSGKLPDNKGDCATPIAQTHDLGTQLKVNATPTLVFADGSIIPGALPKDRLEAELAKAGAVQKPVAATN